MAEETTSELSERRLPLNAIIKRIGTALSVPTTASTGEVLLMIEAKLTEEGRKPPNVIVWTSGPTTGSRVTLEDDTGVFLEVPEEEEEPPADGTEDSGDEGDEDDPADGDGVEQLREELNRAKQEITTLREEVRVSKEQLANEKARYKSLWKINCASTIQYDMIMCDKDAELEGKQKSSVLCLPRMLKGANALVPMMMVI